MHMSEGYFEKGIISDIKLNRRSVLLLCVGIFKRVAVKLETVM